MGRYYTYALKGIAALGLVILAAACQKSGGGNSNNTNYSNACGVGYAYTQYGCLPQGNCGPGRGSYNGQCVAAIQNNGLNGCSYYGQPYAGGYQQQQYSQYNKNLNCNPYGNQYGQYNYYQQQYPQYYNNYGYYPYGTYRGGAYFRFGYGW